MKKIWIFLGIALLLMYAGFLWCLPYSNSNELVSDIFMEIINSSVLIYLLYFIFIILDKLDILYKLYHKTDKAIMYIPYLFIFYFALTSFIAIIMVFGVKMYIFSYRFIPFVVCLYVNELIQKIFKKYNE